MVERHWSEGSIAQDGAVAAANARRRLRDVVSAVWRIRSELLVAIALLAGWSLITYGVAALTAPIAWAFSSGLLLMLLCGWRLLWRVFSDGLYDLSRGRRNG